MGAVGARETGSVRIDRVRMCVRALSARRERRAVGAGRTAVTVRRRGQGKCRELDTRAHIRYAQYREGGREGGGEREREREQGKCRELDTKCTVFKRAPDNKYNLKMKSAREV